MKNPGSSITLFLVLQLFTGCGASRHADEQSDDLQRLLEFMTGSFSSQAQAVMDTNFLDIRLQMVRIWPHRTDGYWLYVEQATSARQNKPYRQRVYHLTQRADGLLESAVFVLENPTRFAGEWMKPDPLSGMSPDSVVQRSGCSIVLSREGDAFAGSTTGRACPSELRGAAYATSEVRIVRDTLISWDRGWDAQGDQVWGSAHGGYIFVKQKPY